MNADGKYLTIARISLLVLLLGFFVASVVVGINQRLAATELAARPRGAGSDPGIRIRLSNRLELMGSDYTATDDNDRTMFKELRLGIGIAALVWAPEDGANPPPERVRRLKAGTRLLIRSSSDGMLLSSPDIDGGKDLVWDRIQAIRIQPYDGDALRLPRDFDPARQEAAQQTAWLAIGERRFRGCLEVRRLSLQALQLINVLPLEAYVEGVVAAEMGSSYPLEALKAQAICARGIAAARRESARAAGNDFDLGDTTQDQQYLGQGAGAEPVRRAVIETRGVIMTVQGQIFAPLYHASSGGFTAPLTHLPNADPRLQAQRQFLASTVLSARPDLAWAAGVQMRGAESTLGESTVILTPVEIQDALNRRLAASGVHFGYVRSLQIGRRDPLTRRVETVIVGHAPNERTEIPAALFRLAIGPDRLRSTMWVKDPERVTTPGSAAQQWSITTRGWGHGIGLSQVSAHALAADGLPARQILERFYGSAALEQFW